jgi:hypothetical protein
MLMVQVNPCSVTIRAQINDLTIRLEGSVDELLGLGLHNLPSVRHSLLLDPLLQLCLNIKLKNSFLNLRLDRLVALDLNGLLQSRLCVLVGHLFLDSNGHTVRPSRFHYDRCLDPII